MLSFNKARKIVYDKDIENLHISKTNSVEELMNILLLIRNKSRSAKNHASLLMEFFFNKGELSQPNVNMLGRIMKGSKEKKQHLDEYRIKIIKNIIWNCYEGSEETEETIWSECVDNMNKTMSRLRQKI